MSRYSVFLLLTAIFFRVEPAYSIFGVEGVPLEDYYEFGKHQTGVASVRADRSYGTANLVDVKDIGIPQLKGRLGSLEGRVLITAAHVIYDKDFKSCKEPEDCSVRFIDKNNESQKMDVLALFTPDNPSDTDDIGFIVLKEPVDVSKFKPLKLNLSNENKSFSGKAVNIFGCTPVFGKVNSSVVIRESADTSLRRGMTTVLDDCTNDRSVLDSNFYTSKGMISIFRGSTRALTESDREKKHKIEEELERFDALINTAQSAEDKRSLTCKRFPLAMERLNLCEVEVRKGLSRQFFYNGNNIQEQLDGLEDTEDLDKLTLISKWEEFINDGSYGSKSLDFGTYQVKFYGPLPRLSGQIYHGDSGGAWVIDDEIVALSKLGAGTTCNNFQVKKVETSILSIGVSEYFTQCETIISQPQSLKPDDQSFSYCATSIWSCRNWIESTLVEILGEINLDKDE